MTMQHNTTSGSLIEDLLGLDISMAQMSARAFYGDAVYERLLAEEARQLKELRIKWATAADRIDDVAHQVKP